MESNVQRIIKLFKPYDKQKEIIKLLEDDNISWVCVNAGRQVGKTTLALNWLIMVAINNSNSVCVWVSRWYKQVQKVLKSFIKFFEKCPAVDKINKSDLEITFKNGSVIKFYSAQNAENIRGETVDFMVADEFSLYPNTVWTEVIMPTFATRPKAKALLISTPRGRGLWYDLFNKANTNKRWANFRMASYDSPFVDQDFIEDFRSTVSDKIFKQEIEAEFIDENGGIFENIDTNILLYKAMPTKYLWAGIDVGFKHDYTVLTIINEKGEMLDSLRFNDENCNFKEASQKIHNKLKEWNWPLTYIEINKWDSVYSFLKELKTPNLHPFTTSSGNKNPMIENLITHFKLNEIKILNDKQLLQELRMYEYEINVKTRNWSFNAPEGEFDDWVMSLALAFWAKKHLRPFSF